MSSILTSSLRNGKVSEQGGRVVLGRSHLNLPRKISHQLSVISLEDNLVYVLNGSLQPWGILMRRAKSICRVSPGPNSIRHLKGTVVSPVGLKLRRSGIKMTGKDHWCRQSHQRSARSNSDPPSSICRDEARHKVASVQQFTIKRHRDKGLMLTCQKSRFLGIC